MSPTGKVNTYSKMSNDTCYTQPYTNTRYKLILIVAIALLEVSLLKSMDLVP